MRIVCPYCNQEIEAPDSISDGQHIRCPYCGEKFEYRTPGATRIEVPKQSITTLKHGWQYKVAQFLALSASVVLALVALCVFWDGWTSLPPIAELPNSWYGNVAELESVNCRLTSFCAHALSGCGKMFAGFVFAKVSSALFRNSEGIANMMSGGK